MRSPHLWNTPICVLLIFEIRTLKGSFSLFHVYAYEKQTKIISGNSRWQHINSSFIFSNFKETGLCEYASKGRGAFDTLVGRYFLLIFY